MQQKAPGPAARVRLLVIDSDAARLYLAGVRDLAAEAAATEDPRVIVTALRILELAPASIRRIWKPLARKLQRVN
jgi:hypothetical protein